MKTPLIILIAFTFLLISCKDNNSSQDYNNDDPVLEKEMDSDIELKETENSSTYSIYDSRDASDSENSSSPPSTSATTKENVTKKSESFNLSGNFIKSGEASNKSCACYCLDIKYEGTSELCLTPSKMYINIRFAKKNNETTNVYLVAPSSKNTTGTDIPWAKFDKNTPIATISPNENGEIELDWLGFSINGDLAIDYAILGKKALEGTYKRN
jgi:hypothetical protein